MDNWDYANDCPLRETLRKRLARERAIARFDGETTPPSARDSEWVARELGDVPYRTMQLTCHDNPQSWAPILQGRDA